MGETDFDAQERSKMMRTRETMEGLWTTGVYVANNQCTVPFLLSVDETDHANLHTLFFFFVNSFVDMTKYHLADAVQDSLYLIQFLVRGCHRTPSKTILVNKEP